MRLHARMLWPLLKRTAKDWSDDEASTRAASLAFYTALSLAPLVVIAVGIAGLAYGDSAARDEIMGQARSLVGQQGAATVSTVLEQSERQGDGRWATAIGFVLLLFGASGVFVALQDSLNRVFDVQPREGRGIKGIIRDRFFSFSMVLVVGFLLLVSLILSAALSGVADRLGAGESVLWRALHLAVSFGVVTALFAMIFKYVPDVKLAWRDVWLGALVTAVLFVAGKYLLGLYLGRGSVGSAYGAAGSLVAMLVWVYYSAQIVFFGAEFTQAYATSMGTRIEPDDHAEPIEDPRKDDRDEARREVQAGAPGGESAPPPPR
jgi:membrane protein